MQEALFGLLLAVMIVPDRMTALRQVRGRAKPLALRLFGRDACAGPAARFIPKHLPGERR